MSTAATWTIAVNETTKSTWLTPIAAKENNFSPVATGSSQVINIPDKEKEPYLEEDKWIGDGLQQYEVRHIVSHKEEKKKKFKKTKTIWKTEEDQWSGESPEETYLDPDFGTSSSSSEEVDTTEQSLPIVKLIKVSKQRKMKKMAQKSISRVSHFSPYTVLEKKGPSCESSIDCSKSQQCISGYCKRRCNGQAGCYIYKYPRQCSWSGNCPHGSHCDNHGYCSLSCDQGDNHCHEDYYCFRGACIPKVFKRLCDTNADCLETEICGSQRVCMKPCKTASQCGPKETCSDGFCLKTRNNSYTKTINDLVTLHLPWRYKKKPKKCKSSHDCPRGFSCSNHGHCKRECSHKFTCSKGII
jgi:hypothetical protein